MARSFTQATTVASGHVETTIGGQGDKPMAGHQHFADNRKANLLLLHEIARQDAGALQPGNGIIDDMVAVLSTSDHGSTAEALAFLRQLYPAHPLTLRLAALVAYSRIATSGSVETARAQ